MGDLDDHNRDNKDAGRYDSETSSYAKRMISIIDYGFGNLGSVSRAFESIGCSTQLVSTPDDILSADYLVLPGVGAFGDGMAGLRSRNLIGPVKEYAKSGKPLLGLCLGMQMLMTESEEFGSFEGLNLIPGRVIWMKPPQEVGMDGYKVPLIGWSPLHHPPPASPPPTYVSSPSSDTILSSWDGTLFDGIPDGAEVYHVHSLCPVPQHGEHVLGVTSHGGQALCSAVRKGNVMGTQFHPEKSGKIGLQILRNFCSMPARLPLLSKEMAR